MNLLNIPKKETSAKKASAKLSEADVIFLISMVMAEYGTTHKDFCAMLNPVGLSIEHDKVVGTPEAIKKALNGEGTVGLTWEISDMDGDTVYLSTGTKTVVAIAQLIEVAINNVTTAPATK